MILPPLVFPAWTINIINGSLRSKTDASKSTMDNSRVTLQIITPLTIVVYDCNLFIVQATGPRLLNKDTSKLVYAEQL